MLSYKKNKVTILGSGTSTGTPIPACTCDVCKSSDQKDKRLRTSILIEINDKKILIDTGPDLRYQMLRANINHLDKVIITHEHADHLNGIDDLRTLTFPPNSPLSIWTLKENEEILKQRFSYIFDRDNFFSDKKILGGGVPYLDVNYLNFSKITYSQLLSNINFEFFKLPHGHIKTLGFYVEGLAYLIDCEEIPAEIINFLKNKNVSLLIIDTLQEKFHDTHLTVEQSFKAALEINPLKTRFIHMNHNLSHSKLTKIAKEYFKKKDALPAYDEEEIEF